jgi:aspartate carbamoyltransferase catalytic subunit
MAHPGSSDPPRVLGGVNDICNDAVEAVLADADQLVRQGKSKASGPRFSLGLVFLESSLRTRLGFSEAAARLGGVAMDLSELRNSQTMSAAESLQDTLRVVSGMVDIVALRAPLPLAQSLAGVELKSALINAGDGGALAEHPSQALIDLFALRKVGPIAGLRIGVCGDLQSRAARSLIKTLTRRMPRELRLMAPASRGLGPDLAAAFSGQPVLPCLDCTGLDAIVMAGLAPQRGNDLLDEDARASFILDEAHLGSLPAHAHILCPMPAIDEISPAARADTRLHMFQQSDESVAVRMALLKYMLEIPSPT